MGPLILHGHVCNFWKILHNHNFCRGDPPRPIWPAAAPGSRRWLLTHLARSCVTIYHTHASTNGHLLECHKYACLRTCNPRHAEMSRITSRTLVIPLPLYFISGSDPYASCLPARKFERRSARGCRSDLNYMRKQYPNVSGTSSHPNFGTFISPVEF